MQRILYAVFLVLCFSTFSCGNKQERDPEGMIVYQENQTTWVRNFEPLNPVSISRWPTRGGIYESLFLNNPITTDWTPWLATGYEWRNNNKKLLFNIRSGVEWSDGKPFSAHDVAYTFNLMKKFPALDSRNSWGFLKSVIAISDLSLIHI